MKSVIETSNLRQSPHPHALLGTAQTDWAPPQAFPAPAPPPPPNSYRADVRAALASACRPQVVDAWAIAETAALGQGHRLREGAHVFTAGTQRAESLWLLVEGRVSLGHLDNGARWRQSRELHKGAWIDAGSAWVGGSHAETALAMEPCLVHEFPVGALIQPGKIHIDMLQALLACVAARGCEAVLERQALLTKGSMTRLTNWLLQHCTPQSDGSATLQLRLQKKDLASELGITPETLSRSLRHLRERNLLVMRGYRLLLPDIQALQELISED